MLPLSPGEVSYRLPIAASPHFADLFEQVDVHAKELGVDAYGISVTTLEEVRTMHGFMHGLAAYM